MMNFNGWYMFGSGLYMIIFWLAIILFIIWLAREISGSGRNRDADKSALDILKERYARDEINKEEFESKKRDLMS